MLTQKVTYSEYMNKIIFSTGHDLTKHILMMHHKNNKGKELFKEHGTFLDKICGSIGSELFDL